MTVFTYFYVGRLLNVEKKIFRNLQVIYFLVSQYWSTRAQYTINNQHHTHIPIHHPSMQYSPICVWWKSLSYMQTLLPLKLFWRHCETWYSIFPSRNWYKDHGYQITIMAKNNGMIPKCPQLYPVFVHFLGVNNAPKKNMHTYGIPNTFRTVPIPVST